MHWLRDIYDSKYGEGIDRLLTVISGRDELADKWNGFSTITHKILLEQFTYKEAAAFLKSKNITNEIIIKTLIEISDRFPILLVLFSENPPTSIEEINDVPVKNLPHLVELLRNCKDEFITYEVAGNYETVVFRRSDMEATTEEVLSDEGIRYQFSKDLEAIWEAEPAASE